MKRIGMLTSGGDCQALNATMRGVVKTLNSEMDEFEIIGFEDGYKGLIYGNYRVMKPSDFSGILKLGGTILGTSRQPFKLMRVPDEHGLDKVAAMKENYHKLGLDCLVVLGGNGSQKSANMLAEEGLNVIGLPKTIDNDIWGTDMTFGFQSAVDIATNCLDCIHTTASSHSRVFVVEIMGHRVGWLTLHAGIAGGADVILLPEIPYDIQKVAKVCRQRVRDGKRFTVIAAAEGAISKEEAALSAKELKNKKKNEPVRPVAEVVAEELAKITDYEIRTTNPGHAQRGGEPNPYDRVLASRLGAHAGKLIMEKKFGNLVVLKGNLITEIPLSESAGKLKYVDPDSDIVKEAKLMGISFGD